MGGGVLACGYAVYRAALTPEQANQAIIEKTYIDWSQVEDDPSERLVISWMPLPRFPNGVEGAFGERIIEEIINIDLKPIFMDAQGYERRKPLMLAGGDIPHVIFEGNPAHARSDAHHGVIVPVPRWLIRKHAPVYFKMISDTDPNGWLFANAYGENWGIPTLWIDGGYPNPGVWRVDWLRNVGIERIPQTLEEFHEALRRFTYDDPDGNGRDDTYGMSGNAQAWHITFSEFFGAYGVLPFDWMELEEDGRKRIVWGGITPRAKEALEMLAEWYEEGIIDPEFVTDGMTRNQERSKFINGRVGYISQLGRYLDFEWEMNPNALKPMMAQLNPDAEIAVGSFPVGPYGDSGCRNWGSAANIIVFGTSVAEKPEIVIRALKMMEYFVANGPEVYIRHRHGERGKHWDFIDPTREYAGGIRLLEPYTDQNVWEREVLTIWRPECPLYEELLYSEEEKQHRSKYQPKDKLMVDALGKPDIVPSAPIYLSDLQNMQLTFYTDVICGKVPIEAFEQFTARWLDRGGRILTEEANELLQVRDRLYQEVRGGG